MNRFIILSVDGGGIRGIIPALFLSRLKDLLESQGCKKPYHKIFDLMAGTSTGGLISLALSVPLFRRPNGKLYDPQGGVVPQLLPGLYETLADKAFPGNRDQVLGLIRQIFTSRYSPYSFQKILDEILQDCTVKKALTNLLITAFDMESMEPVFIKKRPPGAGGDTDPDFRMVDTALATTAVPTYFPPAYITKEERKYCLIDGGIFCINPAISALTEAKKISPDSEFIMLSLGTGTQTEDYKTDTIRRWGFFNWIAPWLGVPLIAAIGEGQRISTNHMLKRYPRVRLYRFDTELDRGKGRIDDGSEENLAYLREKGEEMIRNNWGRMLRLASELLEATGRNQYQRAAR